MSKLEPETYTFNEDKILKEIASYIDNTYTEHYANGKYQATDMICDAGHGLSFAIGNCMKYSMRYGHKGTAADARKDLLKIIHYAIIALSIHDQENN